MLMIVLFLELNSVLMIALVLVINFVLMMGLSWCSILCS